eukprot:scaffold1172_cov247-Pinguiococcus_pyrenoidosus.AAC.9
MSKSASNRGFPVRISTSSTSSSSMEMSAPSLSSSPFPSAICPDPSASCLMPLSMTSASLSWADLPSSLPLSLSCIVDPASLCLSKTRHLADGGRTAAEPSSVTSQELRTVRDVKLRKWCGALSLCTGSIGREDDHWILRRRSPFFPIRSRDWLVQLEVGAESVVPSENAQCHALTSPPTLSLVAWKPNPFSRPLERLPDLEALQRERRQAVFDHRLHDPVHWQPLPDREVPGGEPVADSLADGVDSQRRHDPRQGRCAALLVWRRVL